MSFICVRAYHPVPYDSYIWQFCLSLACRNRFCEACFLSIKDAVWSGWLIYWGLTPFSTIFQSYHSGQFTYSFVSWLSLTSTSYNILSKQLAGFPHRLIAHWWKTNDACHNDFCQTSEIMLVELGFELITPGLTTRVATNWATGADQVLCLKLPNSTSSSWYSNDCLWTFHVNIGQVHWNNAALVRLN